MTTEDAFRRAILADPHDDLPRLVFADRLDERGDHDRAEFIRVQVELAKWGEVVCGCDSYTGGCPACDGTVQTLRRRERELAVHAVGWWNLPVPIHQGFGDPPPGTVGVVATRGFIAHVSAVAMTLFGGECWTCRGRRVVYACPVCQTLWAINPPAPGVGATWSLAGPEAQPGQCCDNASMDGVLAKECADCSGTGRTPGTAEILFAREPVTGVTLVGREPWNAGNHRWGWTDHPDDFPTGQGRRWDLPPDLFALLPPTDDGLPANPHRRWYRTERRALSAASLAAVQLGRSLVADVAPCGECGGDKVLTFPGQDRITFGNPYTVRCDHCSGTGTVRRPWLGPLPTHQPRVRAGEA